MAKVTFDPEDEAPFLSAIFLGLMFAVLGLYVFPIFFIGTALIVIDLGIVLILFLIIVVPILFLRDIFR